MVEDERSQVSSQVPGRPRKPCRLSLLQLHEAVFICLCSAAAAAAAAVGAQLKGHGRRNIQQCITAILYSAEGAPDSSSSGRALLCTAPLSSTLLCSSMMMETHCLVREGSL